ncbi:hypothetical protein [Streptomyces sp. NPDC005046]
MKSRLRWVHARGQHVIVERDPTYTAEVFVKFLTLAFVIAIPVRILHWGDWIPFASASLYLLWELGRISSALAELASLWNGQYAKQQEAERDEYSQKRRKQRDKP